VPVSAPSSREQSRAFLRALGKRVKLTRIDRELSQEQLAVRAGMSRNFVSSIERGAHGVDVVRLRTVAWALGVRIAELLPDEDAAAAAVVDGVGRRTA
jgi:transcriptional regulator with XRE-family HTH domain